MTANEPARVAILGSCVSRDMIQMSLSDMTRVPVYVARQSVLSYYRPATDNKPEHPEFPHPFQLNSYKSDVYGTGLKQVLIAEDIDLVLIDLVDERHGVYVSPIGEVITRSIDGIPTGLYDTLTDWDLVEFGTPEHLVAYSQQADMMKDKLIEKGLFEKTVVIHSPWATHLKTGEEAPLSMGKTADWANAILPSYWKIYEDLGFTIIKPDPDTILGDREHRWGAAPFHYIPEFYDSLAEQIRPYLEKASSDR